MATRPLLIMTTVASALALSGSAHAVPADRKACFAAYEQVQVLMRRSKLHAAREAASECLADVCPSSLRADCGQWLKDIDARAASVVIELRGDTSVPVTLRLDGDPWTARVDGTAIEIDPGEHRIDATRSGHSTIGTRVVVREGEKAQRIVIDIPAEASPPPPRYDEERPVPLSVWLFGGASVLAAGGFTFFAITGVGKEHDLDACSPRCGDAAVSAARGRYITADVFLGVSVVALGLATYFYLARPTTRVERTGSAR